MPRRKKEGSQSQLAEGRKRVVIEGVAPEIDGGRFAVKRIVGDRLRVEADIVADGHEVLSAALAYRHEADPDWREVPMAPLVNDRWWGEFAVTRLGRYAYAIQAWVDHFRSWQQFLQKKVDAGQPVAVELLMGADLIEAAQKRARGTAARRLRDWADRLRQGEDEALRVEAALSPELTDLMQRYPDRRLATRYDQNLQVVVDPVKARFSTWYEMFPRSCSQVPGLHGTFKDCEARLPYVASMGFDVLYLPPIHPIGRINRKGKN
ncbi:MAG TPA: maltotransferase domain-containing protein, partial [Desulfobaccales bacterium]|nr:maltotransferase domain-containing protein [Desulfobaccales bacterium]